MPERVANCTGGVRLTYSSSLPYLRRRGGPQLHPDPRAHHAVLERERPQRRRPAAPGGRGGRPTSGAAGMPPSRTAGTPRAAAGAPRSPPRAPRARAQPPLVHASSSRRRSPLSFEMKMAGTRRDALRAAHRELGPHARVDDDGRVGARERERVHLRARARERARAASRRAGTTAGPRARGARPRRDARAAAVDAARRRGAARAL